MRNGAHLKRLLSVALAAVLLLTLVDDLDAQGRGQGRGGRGGAGGIGRGGPPPTPREGAAFDLTGYWVSVITEDWRHRMVTPPKGDYISVPLNAAGVSGADAWDLDADTAAGNECRPYGAAGVMRLPVRVHITWESDDVLRIDTDVGEQTRLFNFNPSDANETEPTWQGYSVANWEGPGQLRGRASAPSALPQRGGRGFGNAPMSTAGDSLKVVTTGMRAGYLRKNGVPYSEDALLTEYFNWFSEPNGDEWFVVITIVEDPTYLLGPFVTSSNFKKEPDDSGWRPTPCRTDPPRGLPFGTGIQ